jgi:hypothetical protein
MSRYIGPTKWLGGIAVLLFITAAVWSAVMPGLLGEATSSSVLFQAIPFFVVFVGIILLYALLIVWVALHFNGAVPGRTHRALEQLAIVGIVFGTVCLFNPRSFVPYRYGFGMLLISTLAFILWSHVSPPRMDSEIDLPPLSQRQQIVGLIAGLLVTVVLALVTISSNAPSEPYGVRQRAWDAYTPERQADVAAAATQEFSSVEMPFLLIFNLLPGAAVYLVARELAGGKEEDAAALPGMMASAGGD